MPNELPSIRLIIPWFGPWPAWMRCFVESCRWNPTVDWLLFSDAPPPDDLPPNMRIVTMGFKDYRALVAERLGITLAWTDAYKLCDLKPALGFIHTREIAGYDYWGYGDLDVIYGNIRRFYTPKILTHDLVTSHLHIVAGHFSLLRTTPHMLTAFKRVPRWRAHLSTPHHKSFDEQVFSRLFLSLRGRQIWRRLITPYLDGSFFFHESCSTSILPLPSIDGGTEYPQQWFWDRGRLTADRTGDREFLYLHFSHWQSNRWTAEKVAPLENPGLPRQSSRRTAHRLHDQRGRFTPLPSQPRELECVSEQGSLFDAHPPGLGPFLVSHGSFKPVRQRHDAVRR